MPGTNQEAGREGKQEVAGENLNGSGVNIDMPS